jgi:hypothetical protein
MLPHPQSTPPVPIDMDAAVREHRLYYEVYRETTGEGDKRRTTAVELRIWAALGQGVHALPSSPTCRTLERALAAVAEAVMPRNVPAAQAELVPVDHVLYDSRQLPGSDEIYLAIALRTRTGDVAEDAPREAALRTLRRRLELLGVFQGRWQPRPEKPPERTGVTGMWSVREAASVFRTKAPPGPLAAPKPG